MAFVEDLAPFFLDFGITAVWEGASVRGIFDSDYFDPLGNVVEGNSPVFRCATADIVGVAHGDTLVAGAVTYKVVGVEPDGTGTTLLRLEAQ